MNQTPSIGRIVHYRIQNHPDPLPAVITYTNIHNDPEDMAVGLFIMSPFVGSYTMDEVTQGDGDYQWNWPPYTPAPVTEVKPIRPTYDHDEKPEPPTLPQLAEIIRVQNLNDLTPHQMAKEIIELFEGGSNNEQISRTEMGRCKGSRCRF